MEIPQTVYAPTSFKLRDSHSCLRGAYFKAGERTEAEVYHTDPQVVQAAPLAAGTCQGLTNR